MSQLGGYGVNPYLASGGSFAGPSDPAMVRLEMLNANRLAPFQTFQPSGLTGFSSFGAGPMAQMGGLFANQLVGGMAGPGYIMGSAFGPISNGFLPAMQARNEAIQMRQAMMGGAASDTMSLEATARGAFTAMNGGQLTDAIRDKAHAYAGALGSAINSPMGMMSLMALSQATGFDFTGTFMPAQMANYNMFRVGMDMYRGNGKFGVSAGEAAAMGKGFADYYRPNGHYDFSRTRGFNLGEISGLALDLQSRGLGAGFRENVDDNDPEVQDAFIASRRAHHGTLNSSQRASAIDHIRAKKLLDRTDEYLPVMQIMSEMSGGQGSPGEWMQGAQSLTGGLGLMGGNEIASKLSKIREVAHNARITMDVMAEIIKNGMAMAQAAGMTEAAGSTIAVDSVLAAQTSKTFFQGNSNYYGRPTPEGVASFYQEKQIGAGRSPMGKTLGAAMAVLLDRVGGDRSKIAGLVHGNTLLEQLVGAANGGAVGEDFFNKVYGAQGTASLANAISQVSGLSAQDVRGMLANGGMQQQGMAEFNTNNIAYQSQRFDQDQRIASFLRSTQNVNGIVKKYGIKDVNGLTRDLADAAVAPGPEQEQARIQAVAKKYGLSQTDALILATQADEGAMREFGNSTALHAAGALRYGQDEMRKTAAFMGGHASIGGALRAGGFGAAGFTERLISLVQGLGDNANQDLTAFVAQAFGAVKRSDIGDAVKGPVQELASLRQQLADPKLDPTKKAELRARERGMSQALMESFQTENADDFVKDVKGGNFQKNVEAHIKEVAKQIKDAGGIDAYDAANKSGGAPDPVKQMVEGIVGGVGSLLKGTQFTLVIEDGSHNNVGQAIMTAAANTTPGVKPSTAHTP
jgi:hypothetical protein